MNETSVEEPPKPPIKLRIIRRNDTDGFVSKVGSDAIENNPAKVDTPPPQPQIDLPIPPVEQTESERAPPIQVLPAPNSHETDQEVGEVESRDSDEVEPEIPSSKVLQRYALIPITILLSMLQFLTHIFQLETNCIGEGGKRRCC